MSSSQNVPTPARSRSRCACRSRGQRMARHYLAVSPMTLSVSGALSRNCFVGLVVYYMTCCTLKIDRCCIHARFFTSLGRGDEGLGASDWEVTRLRAGQIMWEFVSPVGAEVAYISVASRRLRTRSSYVYLSIPPKSIVMAPVEMLTCNSHMCDTLALQLSPLCLVSVTR